ncbi:MAG TPA: DUF4333 domain-containing protein [Thermoleophilaceae bacterium]
MSRCAVAACLAALCATGAGCGGDGSGDGTLGLRFESPPKRLSQAQVQRIERGIERGIERDHPETDVVRVACPSGVPAERGRVFRCLVRGSRPDQVADATVTLLDDEGGARWTVGP